MLFSFFSSAKKKRLSRISMDFSQVAACGVDIAASDHFRLQRITLPSGKCDESRWQSDLLECKEIPNISTCNGFYLSGGDWRIVGCNWRFTLPCEITEPNDYCQLSEPGWSIGRTTQTKQRR